MSAKVILAGRMKKVCTITYTSKSYEYGVALNDAGSLERGKHGAEPSEGPVHLINVEDAIAIVELPIVHDELHACKSLAERTINVEGSVPILVFLLDVRALHILRHEDIHRYKAQCVFDIRGSWVQERLMLFCIEVRHVML